MGRNSPQDAQSLAGEVETLPRSMNWCALKGEVKKGSTEEYNVYYVYVVGSRTQSMTRHMQS